MDLDALKSALNDDVAGIMLTSPNTLGLFDPHIKEICDLIHSVDGLVYYDGANLNAILGKARPGDIGFDIVHLNLHKTFATPHGGGGPAPGRSAWRKSSCRTCRSPSWSSATTAPSPSTTTARSPSATSRRSTATSASSCGPTPTS